MMATLARNRDRLRASDDGWFIVAGALSETFIGGPGNLPACVAERLRTATERAERAEKAVGDDLRWRGFAEAVSILKLAEQAGKELTVEDFDRVARDQIGDEWDRLMHECFHSLLVEGGDA
jgi:hypothetical protein